MKEKKERKEKPQAAKKEKKLSYITVPAERGQVHLRSATSGLLIESELFRNTLVLSGLFWCKHRLAFWFLEDVTHRSYGHQFVA